GVAGRIGCREGVVVGAGGERRDADRGAYRVFGAFPDEANGRDGVDDLLGDAVGVGGRAVGEQDDELVAADARGKILGAAAGADDGRHFARQLVARGVAGGIVDRLEAVEVYETEGVVAVAAGNLAVGFREDAGEGRPVGKARQYIVI